MIKIYTVTKTPRSTDGSDYMIVDDEGDRYSNFYSLEVAEDVCHMLNKRENRRAKKILKKRVKRNLG